MLSLDRMDPSPTEGGASKEAGPSCADISLVATGLVGVVAVVTTAELGEDEGKTGDSSLKPGLFGEGSRTPGERTRLA